MWWACYNSDMSLKSKVEKLPGYNSLVKPWHYLQAVRAGAKNGWPAKKLKVIAVTGTNGKTSTCFFIWKMLNTAGYRTGVMTTIGWGVEEIEPQIEHMTTESVGILNERMRKIQEAGAEYLVLETTSHALSQSRLLGVPVEIAVFTNLTPEHLDYHKTFWNYRAAKMKLFKKAKCGVINADDENAGYFVKAVKDYAHGDIITYGIEAGDLCATEVEILPTGVKYACGDIKIETQVPGKFNVYNSLAAVAVGQRLGLTDTEIERGIHALDDVEGRMTDVKCGQDFTVIVDYAHQPDALLKVFESLGVGTTGSSSTRTCAPLELQRAEASCNSNTPKSGLNLISVLEDPVVPYSNNSKNFQSDGVRKSISTESPRVISVHGGAGRRDHGTREPRGEILGRYSDVVIITEDDSRDEDPAEIAEMFAQGAEKAGKVRGKDLIIELDREKAIRRALMMAEKGDLVLILGKGHEKTILRNDGAHEFEDIKVAEKILKERLAKPTTKKGAEATDKTKGGK